jgi:hypothetical protein
MKRRGERREEKEGEGRGGKRKETYNAVIVVLVESH